MSVPTPTIIPAKLAFLASPEGASLLHRVMEDPRDDLALAGADWLRSLVPRARAVLLEQRALRLRGLRKQSRAREMLFTPLGLQQMTSEAVALHKAARIPEGVRSIVDLCCGLGGDSMRLPSGIFVVGVDRDDESLRAFRHNVSLYRPASAVLADVTRFAAHIDAAFLDPARRSLASTHRSRDFDTEPEPGWSAIAGIIRTFGNVALKLGPGTALPEELAEGEMEYVGLHDECLELTVRTGSLGRPGWVRAVELPSGAFVEAPACDLPESFGTVGEPGAWFYEPVKCVVRAHLFGVLALRHGLWQLDARTAYLTGNAKVESPMLKRYRTLKVLPCDEAVLRTELAAREIGTLEIKKRALDIRPEEWRKRLRPRGSNAATLVFTRLQGKSAALLVERDEDGLDSAGVLPGDATVFGGPA